MQMGTLAPMKSHTQNFPIVGLNSMISHRQGDGAALAEAQRTKPDLGTVQIAAQGYKAQINLPDDVVEDAVSGQAFKALVYELARERIAADIEYLGLASDTSSTTHVLQGFDGVIASITSNTENFSDQGVSRENLKDMLDNLPTQHKQDKSKMRYLTSPTAVEYYEDTIAQRVTPLGDVAHQAGIQWKPGYSRIALEEIPIMPENLGAGSNRTVVLLGDPKGIYWGFWRKVRVEFQRDAAAGTTLAVFTYRFAAKVADENAWVKGYNVDPNP
jgi:hypothetical protein